MIVAGPLMNFVLAAVLFALILMLQGVPDPTTTKVGEIIAGSPAQRAGLKVGDVITAVNNSPVENWDQLVAETNKNPGQPLRIKVLRDAQELNLTVATVKDESGQHKMGIRPTLKKMDPFSALAKGTAFTVQISGLILSFLGQIFTQQAPMDLGGPVRVVSEIGKAAEFGIFQVMQLAAFLSINLGLFNMLPIPALDGSRVLFLLWEKITGRPVEPSKESFIHMVGFGLLLLLMVVITYNDIVSLMFDNR
ncbi:peptidase [Desulforamulus profundi]|uniref:Peptidase n=1 Tax=Desulforamulus profundi TaxID=1383067 RepID=A0A2C6MHG4_9FIRM|nr:peptidase [Desulforamulus profundi]